jgi:hypothetical protein
MKAKKFFDDHEILLIICAVILGSVLSFMLGIKIILSGD